MIGTVRTGSGFGGLARYLAAGKPGEEHDRVAWIESHNLMETDPERAARLMRATAEQNPRVLKPVYHLSISFAREDRVGPEEMRQVADRVLRGLGLDEHQALVIAHRDTAHPHLHLMINRVHPETGRAWHTGHDYARIERLLRSAERDLGLRRVPGPHSPSLERGRPDRSPAETSGERREQARTGIEPWSTKTRERLAADFKESRSWAELDYRLRRHGFRLRPRGRGLVVTDGHRQMKASRIHRSASAHRLAERFGMSHGDYRRARAALAAEVRRDRAERARHRPAPRPLSVQRASQRRLASAARRLGLQGLSFALRPTPLKAVRLALAISRSISLDRGRGR